MSAIAALNPAAARAEEAFQGAANGERCYESGSLKVQSVAWQ
jgi:hypothetical protein